MNDITALKKRFLDLAAHAGRQNIYTNSNFLTPVEQSLFLSLLNTKSNSYNHHDAAAEPGVPDELIIGDDKESCGISEYWDNEKKYSDKTEDNKTKSVNSRKTSSCIKKTTSSIMETGSSIKETTSSIMETGSSIKTPGYFSCRGTIEGFPAGLFGASASSIRKIAVFGSVEEFGYEWESPIRIVNISPRSEKFAEELSHRDYLGSIMALGIDRSVTGDIIIKGKEAWVYVLDKAAAYIAESLVQVKHTNVACRIVTENIPELEPRLESMNINVASERLDLIVSAASGEGREAAKKLLKDEKVFVNGMTVTSAGHRLKSGDELVIRGYGKFIYGGVINTTRKGRMNIKLKKYV